MVVNESRSSLCCSATLPFFFFLIINRFSLVFHLVAVGLVKIFSCGFVRSSAPWRSWVELIWHGEGAGFPSCLVTFGGRIENSSCSPSVGIWMWARDANEG